MDNITVTSSSISISVSTIVLSTAETNIEPVLKKALDITLITLIALIMLSLGCTIQLSVLKQQIRRPIGVAVGLLCQFILFPAVTFGLAHALSLKQWDALGMIMLGTCPGGSASNLATYWSGGDVALSVIMTAVSTAVGTGMMPLNLWIYSRSWTDKKAVVPYVNIVIALLSILIPVAIGMVIMHKFPKPAKWIARIGGVVGFLAIATAIILNIILYPNIYTTSTAWGTWFGSALLPSVGLVIGYVLAFITRRPVAQRRAIAIETSSQNVALCLTLIFITFDGVDVSRMLAYPSLFGCFSLITLVLSSILFRLCDHRKKKNVKLESEGELKKTEDSLQVQNYFHSSASGNEYVQKF